MRKNSIKNIRINAEVQRELSEILRHGVKDPRIHPMTSIVSVKVALDLKTCKVYFSVLGTEEEAADTLSGLRSAEGFIRGQLARNVNLRNTPELIFILDQSIEYGINMTRKIDELAKAEGRGSETEEDEETEDDGEERTEEA